MKRYKITNRFKFHTTVIIMLLIIATIFSCVLFSTSTETASAEDSSNNLKRRISLLDNETISQAIEVVTTETQSIQQSEKENTEIKITETNDYMYTTDYVHYREQPSIDSEIWGTTSIGQEIYRIGVCDNGWSKVFIDNLECYIHSDFLSTEKPVIQTAQTVQTSYSTYSPSDLMNLGVIYDGGYKYTWYSERVLPGGGLNIPGRYSDGNFVRDENGYICVASSDFDKGTILETPWGTAKVYDCGCASGTIDIYVSW